MKVEPGGITTAYTSEQFYRDVRAGRAFFGGDSRAAGAGAFSHVQLWNPAASGKTVLLWAYTFSVIQTAMGYQLRTAVAALATLSGQGANLLLGGAAAVAAVYNENNAAAQGTLVGYGRATANAPYESPRGVLMEIPAGHGIIIAGDTVNLGVAANFYWTEV